LLNLEEYSSLKVEEHEMDESSENVQNENAVNEQDEAAQTVTEAETSETKQTVSYLKAMPLRDLTDIENIKAEVENGNILILKITPLANKNILQVSQAVNELFSFTEEIGGDIARLGEERIVICPPKIKIWREKTPAQNKQSLPTAA